MAYVVTHLGTATVGAMGGTAPVITYSGGTLSGGSVIADQVGADTTSGTVSDSRNGNYTKIGSDKGLNNNTANGVISCWIEENVSLQNGDTITTTTTSGANIAALYVTGVALSSSVDTAATAQTSGTFSSSSNVSGAVTSGTPVGTADFFHGFNAGGANSAAQTQDGTWTSQYAAFGSFGTMIGAYLTGSGTSTQTYTPLMTNTMSTINWASMIVAIKAAAAGTTVKQLGLLGVG